MSRRSDPFRLVLFLALLGAFGVVLGLSIRASIQPRMESMPITGGWGGDMPGMTMLPSTPVAGAREADRAAAHADVEARRFVQAIPVYERLVREDPHNLEALIHLGVSLASIGRVEQGLAHLDQALAMEPDNLHALWSKGQTLFDIKGDHAASIPVWERIASLVSDSPDGVTARGYVLRAQERLKGSQDAPPPKRSP